MPPPAKARDILPEYFDDFINPLQEIIHEESF